MTRTEEEKKNHSSAPDLAPSYKPAKPTPAQSEGEGACTSSAETGEIPLQNIVFATSRSETRRVTVSPLRIKKALESFEKNRDVQKRQLG